jgi:hypothetical protein
MKRKYVIYAIVCMSLLVLSTCNTNPNETIGKNRITMTTSNREVSIGISSENDLYISWGDSGVITKHSPQGRRIVTYEHVYLDSRPRTITIYGDIKYLDCTAYKKNLTFFAVLGSLLIGE